MMELRACTYVPEIKQDSDAYIIRLFEREREREREKERERERELRERIPKNENDSRFLSAIPLRDSLNRNTLGRVRLSSEARKFPDIIFCIHPPAADHLITNLSTAKVADGGYTLAWKRMTIFLFNALWADSAKAAEETTRRLNEGSFNIRLWRLCFTVWDTRPHSAPSTSIVRLIYVFSRVIRSLSLPSSLSQLPATLRHPCHPPRLPFSPFSQQFPSKRVGRHGNAGHPDVQS